MNWLKELLKKAGVAEDKLDVLVSDISKELPKHFIPKDKYNEVAETKKQLEKDIQDRDKQLDDLKKAVGSNEDLKQQIEKLQADNKKAAEDWQAKVAQLRLDFAIEKALLEAKARKPKAVKALLDLSKVKLDGDQLIGLAEQIKELQKTDSYLFVDATPSGKVGDGTNPPGADHTEVNPWKKDTWNLTQQGRILRTDPAKAAQLKLEAGIKN